MLEFQPRKKLQAQIRQTMDEWPVVWLRGQRQCGKTSIARVMATEVTHRFDLENPVDLARLSEDPMLLKHLQGAVLIDEIQFMPELFQVLRVLADDPIRRATYLLTGSTNQVPNTPVLETLAGRVRAIEMGGFALDEIGVERWEQLWLRGGLPKSFLQKHEDASWEWLIEYLKSVTSDIERGAGSRLPRPRLARLIQLLAHYHGKFWERSGATDALGLDTKTVQRYVDTCESNHLIRLIPPFEANLAKRMRKSPKLYFRDSGLLHTLLRLRSLETLRNSPDVGHSWEGFVVENAIRVLGAEPEECFNWSPSSGGGEIDLLVQTKKGLVGIEVKLSNPTVGRAVKANAAELGLTKLFVIHQGPSSGPAPSPDQLVHPLHVTHLPELPYILGL